MSVHQKPVKHITTIYPGLMAAVIVSVSAQFLAEHYAAPVMLFALLMGMAVSYLYEHENCKKGIDFAAKTILNWGVVLLGFRVTASDIMALGVKTVLVVLVLMAITIGAGFLAAKIVKRGWRFALLTGGAVAICGSSAALAMAAVIPKGDRDLDQNLLFTVVAVTILSTVAMVVYPFVAIYLGFNDQQAGFLLGASIHNVAQVVGAGFSINPEVAETATVVKLLRVSLLPVVILAALLLMPKDENADNKGKVGIPWFVTGFVICVLINSTGYLPEFVRAALSQGSEILLVTAIAGLGIKTSMKSISTIGGGHIVVVIAETLLLLLGAIAVAMMIF